MLQYEQELFSHLKRFHPRFQSLLEKHHQLDKQITELEGT